MTSNGNTLVDAVGTQVKWESIDWKSCLSTVKKLQLRIARHVKRGNMRKVKTLQWLLTHSFAAKCLAVRKVTQNKGHRTPGVDGTTLNTPVEKMGMVWQLRRRNYKALPLRRFYIQKSNGKRRPLGIPSMRDRAFQALHTLALLPVAEITSDWNSYGFRPERCTADAIEQLFVCLSRKNSCRWILEGDIKACFDKISHDWLKENIVMDKKVLGQWLKAGYMESNKLFPTLEGTPQGGIASPTLANMTLDGLENLLGKRFGSTKLDGNNFKQSKNPVLLVRYADDFVVTSKSRRVLEQEVKPMIINFLKERGLELSEEKTRISSVTEGFDFLGQNIRKYVLPNGKEKLLIKPSKKNIKSFLDAIRKIIKSARSMGQAELIRLLNPKIRGWANFHRSVVSSRIFNQVDHIIWHAIFRWATRRHPSKGRRWVHAKYFHSMGLRNHCFQAVTKANGETVIDTLVIAADVEIRRHVKIKKQATPYDSDYDRYFQERTSSKWRISKAGREKIISLWKRQLGVCPVCLERITKLSDWSVHWSKSKLEGGDNRLENLSLIHPKCYKRGAYKKYVFNMPAQP